MLEDKSGKFRKCWMFDTHEAVYHLDDKKNIIGIECNKIQKQIIGVQAGIKVQGYIGNPGVSALNESKDSEVSIILKELTETYSQRIQKWLDGKNGNKGQFKRAA